MSKLEAKAEAKRLRTVSQPIFQPKIVGGDNSAPGDYPWMAGLLERGESDPFLAQFCGGALIHPYWVLTAAHCVKGATLADAVTEIDLASQLLDSVAEGDTEIIRASFPAGVQGFITVEAERPAALAHAIRPVAFPGRAVSTISPELQQDSFGRFYQDFTFPGQPLGEPVNYLAESDAFDVILELYDPTGSTVWATSSSNSAGGGNEALTFTATSIPVIRVLAANGLGGGFILTAE